MWKLLLVCAVLGSGHARMVKKQTGGPWLLPTAAQVSFTNTFRQGVYLVVASSYEDALEEKTSLTAAFNSCQTLIEAKLEICKNDAKEACVPSFWEAIEYYTTEVAWGATTDFFSDGWGAVEGWAFWDDVGSFVLSPGDWFGSPDDWQGWQQIESDFIDIGNWFSGAWGDFSDFFNFNWIKKRSLRAIPAGKSEKSARNLVSRLRALQALKRARNAHQARTSRLSARTIDANVLVCMKKCVSCNAFVNEDTEETINTICGSELLVRNASLAAAVTKIQWVATALNDSVTLILNQTEYGGTMDMGAMTFSEVWLSAKFPTAEVEYTPYTRYLSAEPYAIMDPGTTAANTAIEYWTKYDSYD